MNGRKVFLLVIVILGGWSASAFSSADFDENLIVDVNDLALWTDYWLYDYADNQQCKSWDLDDNGQIDVYDLDVIANFWISGYEFEDFSDFAEHWRRTVDYRFNDTRFDLSANGFVDFGDFSVLAAEWLTTLVSCCDDNSISVNPLDINNWEEIAFRNISPCGTTDCLIGGPDYSDYEYDGCSNRVYAVCKSTSEFGGYCVYNYYFNSRRTGLCVYDCGINYVWVLKNKGGCRFLYVRHITRDRPEYNPASCDEGTYGYYNWQIANTNILDPNGIYKTLDCREGLYFDPNFGGGSAGPCKYVW